MSEFAYLTTIGRRTGRPHCIEIWYAEDRGTLYLLSGDADRADWVRNLGFGSVVDGSSSVQSQCPRRIAGSPGTGSGNSYSLVIPVNHRHLPTFLLAVRCAGAPD